MGDTSTSTQDAADVLRREDLGLLGADSAMGNGNGDVRPFEGNVKQKAQCAYCLIRSGPGALALVDQVMQIRVDLLDAELIGAKPRITMSACICWRRGLMRVSFTVTGNIPGYSIRNFARIAMNRREPPYRAAV